MTRLWYSVRRYLRELLALAIAISVLVLLLTVTYFVALEAGLVGVLLF